jgi:hypothetical protein
LAGNKAYITSNFSTAALACHLPSDHCFVLLAEYETTAIMPLGVLGWSSYLDIGNGQEILRKGALLSTFTNR